MFNIFNFNLKTNSNTDKYININKKIFGKINL